MKTIVNQKERPSVRINEDFVGWLLEQATAVRNQDYIAVDWENVAEELEEMAAIQRGEVISKLRVLVAHLLKWRYSAVKRGERSWEKSILRARLDLRTRLENSRQLRNEFQELLLKAYPQACSYAALEMHLDKSQRAHQFPANCEWTYEQLLDEDFFPEISPAADGRS
jgi:hypothetical protein